jgi:crooked neck
VSVIVFFADMPRLEESELISYRASSSSWSQIQKGIERCRDVYERAIANTPPIAEKRYWRRYIYLWIAYAVFEELYGGEVPISLINEEDKDGDSSDTNKNQVVDGISRARGVFKECLNLIPHKTFTFGKIWLEAAYLEVRAKDLTNSRKILGKAIGLLFSVLFCDLFLGLCPKEKLFKGYIELELQLGEIDRCRTIYTKYLEFMPYNCTAWQSFAQLEINVGESQRAR